MKKNLNYFNYEERNGLFLLCFILILFSTFIFLQKRILPENTSLTVVQQTQSNPDHIYHDKAIQEFNNFSESKLVYANYLPQNKIPEVISKQQKSSFEKSAYSENTDKIKSEKINISPTESFEKYNRKNYDSQSASQGDRDQRINQKSVFAKDKKVLFQKYKKKKVDPISINSKEMEEWKSLRGIGPKYAERILKYQQWLGGFHAKSQLKEVYGITDSLFQEIEPFLLDSEPYKLISINSAELEDLGRHPYLYWDQAKKILKYRKHHGIFRSFEDLKKVQGIDLDQLEKIRPYLNFETEEILVAESVHMKQ